MSVSTVIPCGCCKTLIEPAEAITDRELRFYVCRECHGYLRDAQAQLSRSFSAPANGVKSMPINMRGAYHGTNAPANKPPSKNNL